VPPFQHPRRTLTLGWTAYGAWTCILSDLAPTLLPLAGRQAIYVLLPVVHNWLTKLTRHGGLRWNISARCLHIRWRLQTLQLDSCRRLCLFKLRVMPKQLLPDRHRK
jgi:hypothetical protein